MESSPKHFDKDWLYEQYIVNNLSTYQIGKLVGRDNKSIYNQLKKFEIPTRKRGDNLSKDGTDNYMKNCEENPFKGRKHSDETKQVLSDKGKGPKPWLRGINNGMYGRKGKLNPNYKDGSSAERQRLYASSEWKELVRQVFKRDDYICQKCKEAHKYGNPLHSHHLKSWANNPDERTDIDNLVTLCKKCHDFVHSKKNINKDFIK